ncbi:MAG: ferritin-like domain-containing protein [Flavitalea sp.]
MSSNNNFLPDLISEGHSGVSPFSRRNFLRYAGTSVGIIAVASACKKDDNNGGSVGAGVDLGANDIGILNYAYALEQLEAAFYIKVVNSQYSGITAEETAYLTDIRNHEIAHREFFKNALGDKKIVDLEVDFSTIDFSSRDSVLNTAKAFEDLGVSAYNGAGKLIADVNYLLFAGKIVSVEARHAALIRDLLVEGSFADETVIDANGLEKSKTPAEVLVIAKTYIKTSINASNLPTS